jgi:ribosome modulation factor
MLKKSGVEKWFRHLEGCRTRGETAWQDGKPVEACPYYSKGSLGRQRSESWRAGWHSERAKREK